MVTAFKSVGETTRPAVTSAKLLATLGKIVVPAESLAKLPAFTADAISCAPSLAPHARKRNVHQVAPIASGKTAPYIKNCYVYILKCNSSMPCAAPCDSIPCSKRCPKELTCGHQCKCFKTDNAALKLSRN
jgi:hypothetical protein